MSNQEKGDDLERSVLLVLEAFRTDGHVVSEYALAKKAKYPDFWVKDAKGREWLLECKNREPHGLKQGGVWMEGVKWVQQNILSKAWGEKVYETRLQRGAKWEERKNRINIRVVNPRPVLVTTVLTYNFEAMCLLRDFFGDSIVQTVYPSWYAGSGWVLELVNGMRRLFTSG